MHLIQHHATRLGCLTWLSLLALSACAAPSSNNTGDATPKVAASQALWQQIQAEVGDAACDAPQQCRSVAVGAKACGGPDSYLAWSTQRSDAQRLQALVDQHAQARRDENRAAGMMSNCSLVTDPGTSCQAGRCTLNRGNSGSGGALAQ
jgi:hypothetical protein